MVICESVMSWIFKVNIMAYLNYGKRYAISYRRICRMNTVPIWEKLALTVDEAAEYSNIGINRISNMLNEISCPFGLKVGKKRLIKRKEFEKYIEKSNEI